MEITSQHLFPSRGASMFGQDFELTMQDSRTLQSLLQHNPKTFNEFKVFGLRGANSCVNHIFQAPSQ